MSEKRRVGFVYEYPLKSLSTYPAEVLVLSDEEARLRQRIETARGALRRLEMARHEVEKEKEAAMAECRHEVFNINVAFSPGYHTCYICGMEIFNYV